MRNDISVWSEQNFGPPPFGGMGRTPVFDLKQIYFSQTLRAVPDTTFYFEGGEKKIQYPIKVKYDTIWFENEGKIYAGTHGRGVFVNDQFVSVNELSKMEDDVDNHFESGLKIYPNPVRDIAKIEYQLASRADVRVQIYSLNGRLIMDNQYSNQSEGTNTLQLNLTDLSNGTYVIRAISGDKVASNKLLLYK